MRIRIGRWCAFASWLSMAGAGWTQDDTAQKKAPLSKAPFRLFEKPVDLWQTGRSYLEGNRAAEDPAAPAKPPSSDWGQVVRTPSGDLVYRELPGPLVAVLENPSPENIRAFFEWRLGKARKILTAAEKIKEFRPNGPREAELEVGKGRTPKPEPVPQPERPDDRKGDPRGPMPAQPGVEVTYFHKKGCPPCEVQDGILAEWLKTQPRASLNIVEFGSKPELWREHRVRGTPSLLIRQPKTGKTIFLEGLSDRKRLDEALLSFREEGSPTPQEGAKK